MSVRSGSSGGGASGLSVTAGKTLTVTNSLTLSGTDGSTLDIGTGGSFQSVANMTDTWTASGTTYYGIKLVVADSGHAAASRLLSLQLGGQEQFGVDADGAINVYSSGNVVSWSLRGTQVIAGNFAALSLYADNAVFGTTANGQRLAVKKLTELTTIAAAATTDTTIQMPAGALILSVSTRVTTVIPTATSFSVGDAVSATRFGTSATISTAATTTDVGTLAGAYYNASAAAVRLTMNGGSPAANTGRVRVTIFYIQITPAGS